MSFSSQMAPAWATRTVVAVVALAIWLAFLAGAAQGVGTGERDYWFSPADRSSAQTLIPAQDSPHTTAWSPSSLAARGSMAIARGRRTAPRDLAAAASALAGGVMGCWLLAAGVPIFPVLLVMLGMAAGSTFWWRGVYWTYDTLSPALAVFSAWAGWRWLVTSRPIFLAASGIAAGLAVVDDPSWLACLPAIALFLWERVPGREDRMKAIGVGAVVGICATLALIARVRPPALRPNAWSLGSLTTGLSQEFTPLGLILLAIGVVVLSNAVSNRRAVAVLVAGVIGWQWIMPRGSLEPIIMPVTICGWACVGVALSWAQQTMRPRAGAMLVAAVGILLIASPALTRGRLSALGKDTKSEDEARMAYAFKVSDLPPGAGLIAESRRVDSAVLLSSQRAGAPAVIIPQDLDQLQVSLDQGRQLFAFSGARTNLAPIGFVFERAWAGNTAVAALSGRTACAVLTQGQWADVSLLLANGSFIVHGAAPGAAPGGVTLRLATAPPWGDVAIEPASTPFERVESPHDAGPGIPELDRAAAWGGVGMLATLRIPETGRRSPVTFVFERAPQAAVATAEGARPATICPGVWNKDLTLGRNPSALAQPKMTSVTVFGPGWHSPEADPDVFRWTAAERASIRISVAPPGLIRVTVTATPAARPAQQPQIHFAVNACTFPAKPMSSSQADYDWDVAANCWRAGMNQIWLGVTPLVSPAMLTGSHDTRLLGARIGAVRFARR